MGAMMQCTMGLAPSTLSVVPMGTPVMGTNKPAATIMDNKPALHDGCKLMCNWAGTISITFAGQVQIDVT